MQLQEQSFLTHNLGYLIWKITYFTSNDLLTPPTLSFVSICTWLVFLRLTLYWVFCQSDSFWVFLKLELVILEKDWFNTLFSNAANISSWSTKSGVHTQHWLGKWITNGMPWSEPHNTIPVYFCGQRRWAQIEGGAGRPQSGVFMRQIYFLLVIRCERTIRPGSHHMRKRHD